MRISSTKACKMQLWCKSIRLSFEINATSWVMVRTVCADLIWANSPKQPFNLVAATFPVQLLSRTNTWLKKKRRYTINLNKNVCKILHTMRKNTKVLKWPYINTKMPNGSWGFKHEIGGGGINFALVWKVNSKFAWDYSDNIIMIKLSCSEVLFMLPSYWKNLRPATRKNFSRKISESSTAMWAARPIRELAVFGRAWMTS